MNRTYAISMPVALLLAYLLFDPPATPTLVPTEPPVGSLRVKVSVIGADRKELPARDALVWIPELRDTTHPGAVTRLKIASKEKRFEPRISAVPVGTTVVFPNYDRIFHNVFSLSEAAKFDLGLYRNGDSRSFTFQNPGLVRIYCNIHPQMAAFLMIVPSRVFGQASPEGVVRLEGLSAGRHVIHVWDERGGEWTGKVNIEPGKTIEAPVVLDASLWRLAPHKNKYGKDYPPPDDDENRY